jgi:hypothetical protein
MFKILENINKFLQTENGKKLKELLKIICPDPKPPVVIITDFPKKE